MRSELVVDPKWPSKVYLVDPTRPEVGYRTEDVCLVNVHSSDKCHGTTCIVHAPSNHHMRSWELVWRSDEGFERTCLHGIGHPDPDTLEHRKQIGLAGAHTCDGCCAPSPENEDD